MDYTVKPCPFCGGVAFAAVGKREDDILTYSVICTKCHTGIFRPSELPNEWRGYSTPADAVAAWNQRPEKS